MITVHLPSLLCNRARLAEPNCFVRQGSAKAPTDSCNTDGSHRHLVPASRVFGHAPTLIPLRLLLANHSLIVYYPRQ